MFISFRCFLEHDQRCGTSVSYDFLKSWANRRVKSVQSALTHQLTTSGPPGIFSHLRIMRGCMSTIELLQFRKRAIKVQLSE